MKKLLPLLFLLSIIGCKKEEGTVIAKVGRSTITLEEINSSIPIEYKTMVSREDKKQIVEGWISTELVYNKALKDGALKEPEVSKQIEQIKKQIVVNYWLSKYTYDRIFVGDEDIKEYYEATSDRYNNEYKIAHVVTATQTDAAEVEEKLKRGESFEKLAKEYSIDPSGKNGGIIGYIKLGDTSLPGFEAAAFSLKEAGDISGIVQTPQGFHIIKLLGKRKLRNPPKFTDLKEEIRGMLLMQKQTEVIDSLIQDLKEEIPVETYYELIK